MRCPPEIYTLLTATAEPGMCTLPWCCKCRGIVFHKDWGHLETRHVPTGVVPDCPSSITSSKVALMVWFAATLLNVYVLIAPLDTPSTVTAEILCPVPGVMAKVLLPPLVTATLPEGEIVPPVPADAVIV